MQKRPSLFSRKKKRPYWFYGLIIGGVILVAVLAFIDLGAPAIGSKVVVIPVLGEISAYGHSSALLSGEAASSERIVAQIEQANNDPAVKAIIFEINSPGGTVVASKEISIAVDRSKKPTVAWLREVAASGGYWIAASTDKIIADPATITGSIGVIGSFLEYSGLMEKYGVKYEQLTSGPYKDTGTPFREMNEGERRVLQNKINSLNDLFIAHVSSHRDLSDIEVRRLATGEIYIGLEAYENGLVDVLGGLPEAKGVAEELAGEKLTIIKYSKKKSFIEKLTQTMSSSYYWMGKGFGESFFSKNELAVLAR